MAFHYDRSLARRPTLRPILVVCTANVARSPLLAAQLRATLRERLSEELITAVEVVSAGTDALFGQPAAPHTVGVAGEHGLDLADHQATPIGYVDLAATSLVLTMERRHGRVLAAQAPEVAARTFTVPELVLTLTDRIPAQELTALPAPADDAALDARTAAVVALAHEHRPRRLRRSCAEIPDPVHAGREVYAALAARFDHVVAVLADALVGPLRPS